MAARQNSKRGFTLIELVIVIAVIAILAALLVPTILGQAERARMSRAAGEVNELGKALARLRTDAAVAGGASPNYTSCLKLANLTTTTSVATDCGSAAACNTVVPGSPCWGGPYLAQAPVNDPWNTPYTLTIDGPSGKIKIETPGADKTASTTADNISKEF